MVDHMERKINLIIRESSFFKNATVETFYDSENGLKSIFIKGNGEYDIYSTKANNLGTIDSRMKMLKADIEIYL